MDAGKPQEALEYCRKALAVDPEHFESLLRIAFLLLNEGKYEAAYQYSSLLVEKFPHRFEGFYSIGQYYLVTGRSLEAEEAFRHALSLNPSFMPALKDLSGIYAGRNDLDSAVKIYLKIIEAGEESSQNYYVLAGLEAEAGNASNACRYLQSAISLGFRDIAALNNNRQFRSISNDPQYKKIVAQIR